jgi:hypothetical protein
MTANEILAYITRTGQLHLSTTDNWTLEDHDELQTLLQRRIIRPVYHCGMLAGYRLKRKSNRERKRLHH